MKKFIKKIIPKKFHASIYAFQRNYLDGYAEKSYSQEGEDMILKRIFANQSKGFYVDVGAHHPKRFSNTYIFYKQGWNGINIDAMPGSMKLFKKHRSRDINLEIPISNKNEILTYYMFEESALNSFSKEISLKRNKKIIDMKNFKTATLSSVLNKYSIPDNHIDFMSIDVEGLDFDVLRSNNWNKYHPLVVIVEVLKSSFEDMSKNEIAHFLYEQGYLMYAKSVNTVFFMDSIFFQKRHSIET